MREYYNRNHGNQGDQQLGHAAVCICCGISISRRSGRRSRPLPVGRERDYIANIISPRLVNKSITDYNINLLEKYLS